MLDMTQTIQPRSDQANADDFISGPKTITITNVTMSDSPQQPIHIDYVGGEGKPWKPCLSMRRILVLCWGPDGDAYKGKSLTLYRDPSIKFGGCEQGGIRISHMSDLEKPLRTMLTVSRGKRAPFTVQPLQLTAGPPLSHEDAQLWIAEIDRATNMAELSETASKIKSNGYAESAEKASVLKHYQAAVDRIRSSEAVSEESQSQDPEGSDVSE
jgi:hypothetical protein